MRKALTRIDLRSDTVAKPTARMLQAMLRAEVGDDVYREDPTANRLEKRCADMFGMQAGLFVASGTMGNFVSLLTHCQRGEAAIIGDVSHINLYEQGGMASLGGIFPLPIPTRPDGTLKIADIMSKILPENVHYTRARLIALENTHNVCGGQPLSLEYMKEIIELKEKMRLKLHVDGARIFNAFYALKEANSQIKTQDLAKGVDSMSICFSKGLCCPVGSVIVGSDEFIKIALRWRKVVGGGMRQAGYLAAAAIEALDTSEELITADHLKARKLADGLRDLGCIVNNPMTNIILFGPPTGFDMSEFVRDIKSRGIWLSIAYSQLIRLIPNNGTSNEDIDKALEIIGQVIKSRSG